MPKQLKRTYNFSDGHLIQLADDVVDSATTDLAVLATVGVTAAEIGIITTKRDAFSELPTDTFYSAQLNVKAQSKNEKIAAMLSQADFICIIAKRTFATTPGALVAFNIAAINRLRDSDQIRECRSMHKAATEALVAMGANGLTADMLDDFKDVIDSADVAYDEKREQVKLRDTKTQERIAAGNELYKVVAAMCSTGRDVFKNNEAKYNDYVIYGGDTTPAQVGGGTVPAGGIYVTDLVVDNDNDNITIQNNGSVDIKAYYADDPTDEPGESNFYIVPVGQTVTKKASLGGWTEANYRLLMKNEGATDVVVEVRIV